MEKDITEGNGWGKQLLVQNYVQDSMKLSQYWVQVCIFPSCSCEDFWRRHSHSKPYLPCKHIFWVYKNRFHLDLHNSTLVNQPILTVGEVQYIIQRQVWGPWSGFFVRSTDSIFMFMLNKNMTLIRSIDTYLIVLVIEDMTLILIKSVCFGFKRPSILLFCCTIREVFFPIITSVFRW